MRKLYPPKHFPGETNLRTKSVLIAIVFACLAAAATAAPKLQFSWKNPNYTGGAFKNILVLALNGKAANRAEFEDELVAAISRPGTNVFPSYEFLARPDATPIDMKDFRELVREQKFDGIVVARLTKRDVKTTYVPGQVYTPYPYYGTFYGYYAALYPVVYSPGYMQTEKVAQVEVNFYSTQQSKKTVSCGPCRTTFHSRRPSRLPDVQATSVPRRSGSARLSAKSSEFAGSSGK
jgi:hypothetical protein